MSSSSGWAETTIVASAAAALSAYFVLKATNTLLLNTRDNANTNSLDGRTYPHPATFLQNRHTIAGNPETTALQNRGWSMEEALQKAKDGSVQLAKHSPLQVLQSLQMGNSRFWTGTATRPEVSAFERRALIKQQFPQTAVLGCSDSRVPVEIVFDQGLGDLFVVRVAGNCLGTTTQASLEYAVHHLHVKVLLVMGHEGCGAIRAAGLPDEQIQQESKSLASVLTTLKQGLQSDHLEQVLDARARDREAVAMNVRNQIKTLCQDPQILQKVQDGSLVLVGAFYEISSGIVDFFMQVSKEGDDRKPFVGVQSRYHPDTEEIVFA